MSFDRTRLPDPLSYYESAGLKFLEHRTRWRTTRCEFHGGSDSMRINVETGGFCCMNCSAHGGDVLAYRMAVAGEDFVTACKALGCWVENGRAPGTTRPTPLPARDAIQLLRAESNLVAVAAGNVALGVVLSEVDQDRLLTAAARILHITDTYA